MPVIPNLEIAQSMKTALTAEQALAKETPLSKKYKGFRKFIDLQWSAKKGLSQDIFQRKKNKSKPIFNDSTGVRAAFYVDWDPQSFYSLRGNIDKLNLVIPEWFFLDPKTDTLITKIDGAALRLIKKAGVKITPLLTNNINQSFNGDVVHRILHSPAKKQRLIRDIEKVLLENKFEGINIDFEELPEKTNEPLTQFQKELYTQLHQHGLLVTQEVSPFNQDYDYAALSKYNDLVFLMAYDEHSPDTRPGTISGQRWIEAAVDELAKQVSFNKIVLNMAGYGYDWSKDSVQTVTYAQALVHASDNNAKVDFDNDTYNVKYTYTDAQNNPHQVYLADAATNFNTMRFATEYGLAGTALWRLGSEDSRLWSFYNKPMSIAALQHLDFSALEKLQSKNPVDYIGEGEVLDVIATPRPGHIQPELDTSLMLISEENYDSLPSQFVVRKWGKADNKLVLTFDDGPDPLYTKQILDTLAKYHVPGSFFVVGIMAENNIPLVKRIYREGHEIGNHTFTHPNMAEVGIKRAYIEMDATRLLIECITGHSTIMFRPPFNADSEPESMQELIPVSLSRNKNYLMVGESIDPEDWEAGEIENFNADTVFNRVVRYHEATDGNIILLHDAGGDRSATVEAVPKIIKYFEARGYTFTTVADLLGKKREDLMPPVPRDSGYYIIQVDFVLAEIGYYLGNILYSIFITFLILGALRLMIVAVFAYRQRKKEKTHHLDDLYGLPLVSIIVPAYNEEVNAVSSIQNLLQCDYKNFEIIFIDDGSTDDTFKKVSAAFNDHSHVKVFTKPNGGKASALNYGIAQSHADFVICIDADTKLKTDAVRLMVKHFNDENVGAVAGTVKVGNEVNLLTRWQSIEYTTSQNFDRKAFVYVNAITVVPGAIGAFRKDAMMLAGGFTTDTLAEDCDLTIRILHEGYRIANEPAAIAFTEAPETLRQFMKQRFRWTFGVMQTFWKHHTALFNLENKGLGWAALPDILLFKYIIPLFAPIADALMFIGLLSSDSRGKIGKYYLIFLLVDALIAYIAFVFEKEKPWKLIWLIPQRLIYRWIMLIILFRSIRRAAKGELQNWGVLKRTGNVKDIVTPSSIPGPVLTPEPVRVM